MVRPIFLSYYFSPFAVVVIPLTLLTQSQLMTMIQYHHKAIWKGGDSVKEL